MESAHTDRAPPVFDRLHPWIQRAIGGLIVGFGLAAIGITVPGRPGLVIAAVALALSILTVVSLLPWRQRLGNDAGYPPAPSFDEWSSHDFSVWSGPLKGSQASVEILLPIAAGAFGLSSLALVAHLTIGV